MAAIPPAFCLYDPLRQTDVAFDCPDDGARYSNEAGRALFDESSHRPGNRAGERPNQLNVAVRHHRRRPHPIPDSVGFRRIPD
ncbi:hypothetical protein D3C81_1769070 [compost metagenome]